MKISADPKSPVYSSRSAHAAIYLDGALLRHCITADDQAGTAECFDVDNQGLALHDGQFTKTITLHGRVSIAIDGMDFDSWMRERTNTAHQAMMAHAQRGAAIYT